MDSTTMKSEFGKCFREAREACKLSRAALGLRLGISPKTIQSWEMGRTFPEDLALIPAIEQELGVSFSNMISLTMNLVSSTSEAASGDQPLPLSRTPMGINQRVVGLQANRIAASDYIAVPMLKPSAAAKAVSDLEDADIVKHVLFPAKWISRGKLLVAYRMKDSAMEPVIPHGASLLVDARQTDHSKLYGQVVAIWHHEQGLRIRRMAVNPDGKPVGLPGREEQKGLIALNFSAGDRIVGVVIGVAGAMMPTRS